MEVFHVAFQKICSYLSFEHALCHMPISYIALQLKLNRDDCKISRYQMKSIHLRSSFK